MARLKTANLVLVIAAATVFLAGLLTCIIMSMKSKNKQMSTVQILDGEAASDFAQGATDFRIAPSTSIEQTMVDASGKEEKLDEVEDN